MQSPLIFPTYLQIILYNLTLGDAMVHIYWPALKQLLETLNITLDEEQGGSSG